MPAAHLVMPVSHQAYGKGRAPSCLAYRGLESAVASTFSHACRRVLGVRIRETAAAPSRRHIRALPIRGACRHRRVVRGTRADA